MIDLHMHTYRCRHAEGSVADYVARATELGLSAIAVTDHLPLPASVLSRDPRAAEYAMPVEELEAYIAEVTDAAHQARLSGGPEVLLGIEADHLPGDEEYTRAMIERYPFDVVLGSVHMIDGWTFDDPERIDGYSSWDIGELWDRYFAQVAAAAATGMFDVLGHVDLVKKFRFVPEGDLNVRYERFADAIESTGVAVEVNTAGLRKPCEELYPSLPLLRALARRGIPVTIGSDAHAPADVGAGYDEAVAALAAAGYRSAVVFERREAREVSL